MEIQVARNFEFLLDNFSFEKCRTDYSLWESKGFKKQGFVFEGGSGSAKTWDIIQFLIYYCQQNEGLNKDILIFRETYADLKKTVLKDFVKILKKYGIYSIRDHTKSQPQNYNLFGNIIYFSGLDSIGSHGERHDVIWGNEGMELDFDSWKQLNQRCNELFLLDYNPSVTDHWIYNSIVTREDTQFIKSTMLDNPFLPPGQRNEILNYKPTQKNIEKGTADDYMWKVYGLGERAMRKGVIFKHVNWVESFPDAGYWYGLDFGFTNDPTCLVKTTIVGNEIFLEPLIYEPIETPELLNEALLALNIEKTIPITADSSDKYANDRGSIEMVRDLQQKQWQISKVHKNKTVVHWINKLKEYKINIVKNHLYREIKKEQENYKWREVNGMQVNQPIDKYNHFWDASRYALISAIGNNNKMFINY